MGKPCSVCDSMNPLERLAVAPRAATCGGPGWERQHRLRQGRAAAARYRARRPRHLGV